MHTVAERIPSALTSSGDVPATTVTAAAPQLMRLKKPVEDNSATFGYDDLGPAKAAAAANTVEDRPSSTNEGMPPPPPPEGLAVAAKWDLNPLRSMKKKSNIIS